MKICMYLPQPGPTRAPEVTANLARLGNEVIAISPPDRQMIELGINIKPVKLTTLPFFGKFIHIIYAFILAAFIIARWKPDVIYTLGSSMGTGLLLAKLFRCPLIFEANGFGRAELKMVSRNPFYMLLRHISCRMTEMEIRHSDHVIVVIDSLGKAIQEHLHVNPDRITVIPNGANTRIFMPLCDAKNRLQLDLNCYYVGFVGTISEWQGLDYIVRSAPSILGEIPSTRFLLVGNGPMKAKLNRLAEDLNVAKEFVFIGEVPYSEVPKYINAMDIGISFRKGTPASPMKLYEYAACGKPVVATDNSDHDFVREHSAGILVDPENPEEVANAITSLLRNGELRERMGSNGRKYVLENRSWEAVAREVEEVINAVIGK